MMTPLILKGCKSVQYFITQKQAGNITQAAKQSGSAPACQATIHGGGWWLRVEHGASAGALAAALGHASALLPGNCATIVSYTKAENME